LRFFYRRLAFSALDLAASAGPTSSALDEVTGRVIMDHIRRIVGDVTILAMTHRKNITRYSDAVASISRSRQTVP
jgi:ABC-type lipoprotein export system ATPase subunit